MADQPLDVPARRGIWRSTRFWVAMTLVLFFVVAYIGVVTLYGLSGRAVKYSDLPAEDPSAITLEITPQTIDGLKQRVSMDVDIVNVPAEYESQTDFSVSRDITIMMTPVDGTPSIQLKAGTPTQMTSMSVVVSGHVENWPLDRYTASQVTAVAYLTDSGPSAQIPVDIRLVGEPPGWNAALAVAQKETIPVGSESIDVTLYDFTVDRAGSIKAFGFVLLALLIAMPTLVLFVAVSAYLGRRRVEATLTSWMGTMLFATISVRTFFPGSPPIGSWVDILVVLWVIVALVVGLAIYVAAWNRWGKPYPEYRRGT
jgi:hypothetical protein